VRDIQVGVQAQLAEATGDPYSPAKHLLAHQIERLPERLGARLGDRIAT
jgi:hypothetical protein